MSGVKLNSIILKAVILCSIYFNLQCHSPVRFTAINHKVTAYVIQCQFGVNTTLGLELFKKYFHNLGVFHN